MSAKLKRLAITLTIAVILFLLTLTNFRMVSSSDTAGEIDIFTQKVPFNGKGINQSSDAFQPQELVILYALVTYNEYPIANVLVAFRASNPANASQDVTVIGVSSTNQSGIAQFSFRIPWPSENGEEIVFGDWSATATAGISEHPVIDTLTFQVGWIIQITNITTLNGESQPQTQFARGDTIVFNLTVENIALTLKSATITIDVQDVASYPILHIEMNDLVFQPGKNNVCASSQISMTATFGEATVSAVAYTVAPEAGGVPYSPAALLTFEIVGSPVKQYYLTVTTNPYGVLHISGEGLYDEGANVVLTAPEYVSVSMGVRYVFSYWDVDAVPQGVGVYEIAIHMDANHTATANYAAQFLVVFDQAGLDETACGTVATINGTSSAFSEFPYDIWVDSGAVISYSYSDVSSNVSGKRFILVDVTGSQSSIVVTGPVTVVGNYKTQFYLTVKTDPPAITIIPNEGWYDQYESVILTASSIVGYDLGYWDVDGVSQDIGVNTLTVYMDRSHTATIHYSISAKGWYVPDWFFLLLLLLLILLVILLIVLVYRRKRRKKAEEAFRSGWTAWYHCYDLRKKNS